MKQLFNQINEFRNSRISVYTDKIINEYDEEIESNLITIKESIKEIHFGNLVFQNDNFNMIIPSEGRTIFIGNEENKIKLNLYNSYIEVFDRSSDSIFIEEKEFNMDVNINDESEIYQYPLFNMSFKQGKDKKINTAKITIKTDPFTDDLTLYDVTLEDQDINKVIIETTSILNSFKDSNILQSILDPINSNGYIYMDNSLYRLGEINNNIISLIGTNTNKGCMISYNSIINKSVGFANQEDVIFYNTSTCINEEKLAPNMKDYITYSISDKNNILGKYKTAYQQLLANYRVGNTDIALELFEQLKNICKEMEDLNLFNYLDMYTIVYFEEDTTYTFNKEVIVTLYKTLLSKLS